MNKIGLVVTVIGSIAGIVIGIVKKSYRTIGFGITLGSLFVGLPVTFMSDEAQTESLGKLSDTETEVKKVLTKFGIDLGSNSIIDEP